MGQISVGFGFFNPKTLDEALLRAVDGDQIVLANDLKIKSSTQLVINKAVSIAPRDPNGMVIIDREILVKSKLIMHKVNMKQGVEVIANARFEAAECIFETGDKTAVFATSGSVVLDGVTIKSGVNGVTGKGKSNITILRSKISNVEGNILWCADQTVASVLDSDFGFNLDSSYVAIGVSDTAQLRLEGTKVHDTPATGMRISENAQAVVNNSIFERFGSSAVLLDNSSKVTISNSKLGECRGEAAVIMVSSLSFLDISTSVLHDSEAFGLTCVGEATALASELKIMDIGWSCLFATDKSKVTLNNCSLVRCEQYGITSYDTAEVKAYNCKIVGNKSGAINSQHDAQIILEQCEIDVPDEVAQTN